VTAHKAAKFCLKNKDVNKSLFGQTHVNDASRPLNLGNLGVKSSKCPLARQRAQKPSIVAAMYHVTQEYRLT
jgi:hypothetical protein